MLELVIHKSVFYCHVRSKREKSNERAFMECFRYLQFIVTPCSCYLATIELQKGHDTILVLSCNRSLPFSGKFVLSSTFKDLFRCVI